MNTKEAMRLIAAHPVMRGDVSMQMQPGLPWFEKKQGKLCLRLRLHRQELVKDNVVFYTPGYEVTFVYPFEHIISFKNLRYEPGAEPDSAACTLQQELMLSYYRSAALELYETGDLLLDLQEKDGSVSDAAVAHYQQMFTSAVQRLKMEALYAD